MPGGRLENNIFKEYDIRGMYPEEIDEGSAYNIGRAFADYKKPKKVLVARDFRGESAKISEGFISGLIDSGCQIYDLGVDSTPSLFFGVGKKNFDGGAIMTASHNPDGYTGIKMCGRSGVVLGQNTGLKKIAVLSEKEYSKNKKIGQKKSFNILSDYYRHIFSFIKREKIKGFKIVIDSSGGSGSRLLDYVFTRVALKVTKMNFKAHDQYPDHGLNPTLPKNNFSIRQQVKKQKADIGVLCDGDADRSIFIDEKGQFVHPFYINCLIAEIILAKKKGITILIDARLPVGLSEVIKKAGGKIIIHRAGYANIIQTMTEKKLLFGCENSGHFMFNFSFIGKKNYVYGDSIIPVFLILEYLRDNNFSLSQAIKPFKEKYFISGEINLKGVNFNKVSHKIKKRYPKNKKAEIDGLSVYGQDWFFNIRPSHTEPLIRLNIETRDKIVLSRIKKELLKLIK